MILVNKHNTLIYKKKRYRCSLGKNGLNKAKIEGDKSTPVGLFSLGNLYVRTDRIKVLKTHFKYISISKTMAWSDEPNSKDYNKLINVNYLHKEILYRTDHIYDLILVINYNIEPIIPRKGSAIFIHISKNNYSSTQGCIGLNQEDFTEILLTLKPSDKIKISEY
jgi:L,D-peptidoglycan transpeptidase YkuD (ErfK/YbiS/YcfS/YnhG family)